MKETEQDSHTHLSSRNKLLWLLLISLTVIIYLTSYNTSSSIKIYNTMLYQCPPQIYSSLQYECQDFDPHKHPILAMEIRDVGQINGFIVLEAFPVITKDAVPRQVFLEFELSIFAVDKNRNIVKTMIQKKVKRVKFSIPPEGQQDYAPIPLADIMDIEDENYVFVLRLINIDEIQEKQVHDFRIGFVTLNSSFESHVPYFKWFLFAVALFAYLFYQNNISKLPQEFVSNEQNYVKYMGFLVILFDQPILGHMAISRSSLYAYVSVIVVALLSSLLVLFWLSLLERVASQSNAIPAMSRRAINIFVSLHFIVIAASYGMIASDKVQNPLSDFYPEPTFGSKLSHYYLYCLIAVIGVWSLVRLFQILKKFKEVGWRESTSIVFTFYYLLCSIFFMNNGSLQVPNIKGTRIILLYGITTLYIVLLQVLYASFEVEIEEAHKRRKYDNPRTKNQYEDLDGSTTSKKDNIDLRSNDELQNKDSNRIDDEGL